MLELGMSCMQRDAKTGPSFIGSDRELLQQRLTADMRRLTPCPLKIHWASSQAYILMFRPRMIYLDPETRSARSGRPMCFARHEPARR